MRYIFTTGGPYPLSLYLRLANGREVDVQFSPAVLYGNVGEATFSTSDSAVAEKLKKHPYFGSNFFLKKTVEEKPVAAKHDNTPADYRAMCSDPENIVEEQTVVDVATAQNWCQRTHGAVFSAKRADTIKAEAAKTYNTIFVNWL